MSRASHQRIVTLALAVLDRETYGAHHRGEPSLNMRLALAALWFVMRNRVPLTVYWERASKRALHPWESCREPYFLIAKTLRDEGWDAPV